MSVTKKCIKANRYQLNGALKKNGVNIWRYTFNGIETSTGLERKFFVELSMINPYLSQNEVVLGFKSRMNISADDLQNVLAGTASAQKIQSESILTPSYVVVRAGVLGAGAKEMCEYHCIRQVEIAPKEFQVKVGNCLFTEEKISGRMDVSLSELHEQPELLCNPGIISWELRYDIRSSFDDGFENRDYTWLATGARTVFAGTITLDGKEYNVIPKKSFGYLDRKWGKTLPSTWIHLSSCNLTSMISGKTLTESSCAVQGMYDEKMVVLSDFEGKKIAFSGNSIYEFSQLPESEEGEKLHWTVSANNKSYVIDIDIFTIADLMFVRSIELPDGGRKILKVLSGGTGSGEIRLYKKIKKNLELIEHAKIQNCLCEYGKIELPEN